MACWNQLPAASALAGYCFFLLGHPGQAMVGFVFCQSRPGPWLDFSQAGFFAAQCFCECAVHRSRKACGGITPSQPGCVGLWRVCFPAGLAQLGHGRIFPPAGLALLGPGKLFFGRAGSAGPWRDLFFRALQREIPPWRDKDPLPPEALGQGLGQSDRPPSAIEECLETVRVVQFQF
jgi:hypothetical protein